MDWNVILTGIGTFLGLWAILTRKFDHLERRMDRTDIRIDALEERIFYMATGKTLKEAVEEQLKQKVK